MPHYPGHWIRLHKRMAIYFRDDFDCVYCRCVFPIDTKGYGLTLDHVDPNGGNEPSNLVTCCRQCNSEKRRTNLKSWFMILRDRGIRTRSLRRRISRQTGRPLNMFAGRWLAKLRCSNYGNYGYK